MQISGRNRLRGKITSVSKGEVMAKVVVDVGGQDIISLISCDAVDEMNLQAGDAVTTLIKSTSVMLMK